MKNNILVIGHFGYITNHIDGQTIKTRNTYDLLNKYKENFFSINYFDTEKLKKNKFFIFKMFFEILNCKKIVYLPAQNNLKYIFPFLFVICKIKRIDILYFVIGGWLAVYLKNKKFYIYLLSKIQRIFVESEQLNYLLVNNYNLNNITVFPNFRIHSFTPTFSQNKDVFKIVFMARINRMKGIEAIFRLAERIEKKYGNIHKITIDFWGPIEKSDEVFFRENIRKFKFINYNGILDPQDIYPTLTNYDLSVLPTRYQGEGFPGTILDSYISGIPVIVSDWKYLPEFVEQGKTGFVFDLNREDEFYDYVDKIYNDRNLLIEMKKKSFEKSKMYSSESAWLLVKQYFIEK